MDEKLVAALIAGVVSLTVGVISFFATRSRVRSEMTQTQFRDILKERIGIYPRLWSINIRYETNWTNEGKPKDRDWAQQYLEELNAFNVEGGLFFSQSLYLRFVELRTALMQATTDTEDGHVVNKKLTTKIRNIVYGERRPGLSTKIRNIVYGEGRPGLSTNIRKIVYGERLPGLSYYLKDDLGSYRGITLQRRTDTD